MSILDGEEHEWGTWEATVNGPELMFGIRGPATPCTVSATAPTSCTGDFGRCPFPDARLLRVFARVRDIATLDESVHFQNVPAKSLDDSWPPPATALRPRRAILSPDSVQKKSTASGINAELLPPNGSLPWSGDLCARLKITPAIGSTSEIDYAPEVRLPNSSLCQKFGKPVQIVAFLQGGRATGEQDSSSNEYTMGFYKAKFSTPIMKDVVLTFRQQAIVTSEVVPIIIDLNKWDQFAQPDKALRKISN